MMSDTITIRTQLSQEWDFIKNHIITDTWIVYADADKVCLALIGGHPDDNRDWDLPTDAAKSLGESLIKYAHAAKPAKA